MLPSCAGGEVQLYAPSAPGMALALAGVRALEGTDLEEGTTYAARIAELQDYGAVLELASGARHLLPISEVRALRHNAHARVLMCWRGLFGGKTGAAVP